MNDRTMVERTADWVELRAKDDGGDGYTLEGYAAVFDTPTRIDSWEGVFDEQVTRGAFRKTLKERVPVLQFDHGHDARVGSVPIGAIEELREDKRGLFVRARLFANDVVEPVRQAIEGGAISGMSFRFRVLRDEWDESGKDKGRVPVRTIKEVQLFELGPVVFPAYEATSVGVRDAVEVDATSDRAGLTDPAGSAEPTREDAGSTDHLRVVTATERRQRAATIRGVAA